jgi:molybdate transport system ATP-binding protein
VGSKLEEAFLMAGDDTPGRRQLQRHLYELFHLGDLLDKYIILLSSGELRKYKLAAALFGNPRLLVIDNPFIGLDAPTREQLQQLLATLASEQHLQLVLVLSRRSEVPAFVDRVVEMGADGPVASFDPAAMAALVPPAPAAEEPMAGPVISMQDVTIRYGARTILSHLDWQVRQGEHWALQGQNGSGKSTLLSLVCADNPQAYACDIALFGHRRGSGESIWDVKRRIGYVSPEMHRSYRQNLPAIRVVASGLKDSIGLYVKPNEAERELCRRWMQVFGLQGFDERPFLSLSSGEQRLVLLARAFVKSPDLLILDEPLHGLDDANRQLVKQVIETYCSRRDKTLIMVTHYDDELPPCIDHRLYLKRN